MNAGAAGNYPNVITINPPAACAAPAPTVIYPTEPDGPFIVRYDQGAAAAPMLPTRWFSVMA